MKEWNCNFIFTGEEPVTKASSGGGVKNRCIEIEATEKLIEDGNTISNFVRENYGFAGKEFIQNLPKKEELQEQYKTIFEEVLEKIDTTDKQAMAIASILLADRLSTELFFKDKILDIEEIKNWIASTKEVDIAERAYEWTIDWVSQNSNKFKEDSLTEVWGKTSNNVDGKRFVYINKKVYLSELSKAGYEFDAIKKKLSKEGKVITGKNEYAKATRIGEDIIKCIQIKLPDLEEKEEQQQQELPF